MTSYDIFLTAFKTLEKLSRNVDADGLFRRMQISTTDYHIIYICCSSLFSDHYIVHDVYVNSKSNRTQHLDKKNTIRYIISFDTIIYIGIDEDDDDRDERTTIYKYIDDEV